MFVGDVRWAIDRLRHILEVVRREPVVVRADEGLEESPGAATDQAERFGVGGRQLRSVRLGRPPADPPGNERRRDPQGDEGPGQPCRRRPDDEDGEADRYGNHDAAGHLAIEPGHILVDLGLGLRGGRPFEESLPRYE